MLLLRCPFDGSSSLVYGRASEYAPRVVSRGDEFRANITSMPVLLLSWRQRNWRKRFGRSFSFSLYQSHSAYFAYRTHLSYICLTTLKATPKGERAQETEINLLRKPRLIFKYRQNNIRPPAQITYSRWNWLLNNIIMLKSGLTCSSLICGSRSCKILLEVESWSLLSC